MSYHLQKRIAYTAANKPKLAQIQIRQKRTVRC